MHFNGASLAVEHQDWAHKKTDTIVGGMVPANQGESQ